MLYCENVLYYKNFVTVCSNSSNGSSSSMKHLESTKLIKTSSKVLLSEEGQSNFQTKVYHHVSVQ